jgi:arginine deiminase
MAISVPPPRDLADRRVGDVRSETGRLRQVLVHRPGRELARLTPANARDLLFDDVVWEEHAGREHAALADLLAAEGVEVLYLMDLLSGALAREDARRDAVALAAQTGTGRESSATQAWLDALEPADLAAVLIEGATCEEAGLGASDGGRFAVAPAVNQMFVRDTSAWLGRTLVLGARANSVRSRESALIDLIYRAHPFFEGAGDGRGPIVSSAIEGGDLICLGEDAVLVGIGSRTSLSGAEQLAQELFARGFRRVLAVGIPRQRDAIHLDCLMSLVDRDLAVIDRRLRSLRAFELRPGPGGAVVRPAGKLEAEIAATVGVPKLRVVEVANEREQWMLAANVLAVGPGRVVAYDRNVETNSRLAAAGATVLAMPGAELSRGRGGPRCLTCPLLRDAAGGAADNQAGGSRWNTIAS